jgi:hypothetical protein
MDFLEDYTLMSILSGVIILIRILFYKYMAMAIFRATLLMIEIILLVVVQLAPIDWCL